MERRDFIRKSVLGAAAFTIVPRHVLGGPGFTAPSDQITKAIVGVGGIGYNHHFTREGRLVAVCDVDRHHLEKALKRAGDHVKGYSDFRELLLQKDIDIVHIRVVRMVKRQIRQMPLPADISRRFPPF